MNSTIIVVIVSTNIVDYYNGCKINRTLVT